MVAALLRRAAMIYTSAISGQGPRPDVNNGPGNDLNSAKANLNTGGALLEFPMRTAMHGESRVSSAMSVCDN